MNNSKLTIGLVLVAILAIGAYLYNPQQSPASGVATGPQHLQEESFWQGLQIGQRGSDFKNFNFGTGVMIGIAANIAASSSKAFDIAVPGALSGDKVFVFLATSTIVGQGWSVDQASASSTPGFITVDLVNNTGASAYPPASIASTTQYMDLR